MSYYLGLTFCECENMDVALKKAYSLMNKVSPEHIKNYYKRSPLFNRRKDFDYSKAIKWLSYEFNVTFLFFENYKLLALQCNDFLGDLLITEGFDNKVVFQNSTDDDYPVEYWGTSLRNVFEKEISEITELSVVELKKKLIADDVYDEKEIQDILKSQKEIDRCKNSYIFKVIHDLLGVQDILYNTSKKVKRFTMNALFHPDVNLEIISYINVLLNTPNYKKDFYTLWMVLGMDFGKYLNDIDSFKEKLKEFYEDDPVRLEKPLGTLYYDYITENLDEDWCKKGKNPACIFTKEASKQEKLTKDICKKYCPVANSLGLCGEEGSILDKFLKSTTKKEIRNIAGDVQDCEWKVQELKDSL